jgi:aryl-alcohol dehydrogenase-like predicted oxidoreductase
MKKNIPNLQLSKVTLGTMRFLDKNLNTKDVTKIIDECFAIGIDTNHTSFEYNSYQLYLNALKNSTFKKQIKHIVKLSSPHFEDNPLTFSSKTLENKVDEQLKNLNIEQIDVLQWLVRSKPINDKDRLNILAQQTNEIEECLSSLKQKGKIKSVFSFPYSVPFAKQVLKLNQIDGIISYLNLEENDYSQFANNTPFIAIRPFLRGTLLQNGDKEVKIKECLKHIDSHKNVLTKVISINSLDQVSTFKQIKY